MGGVSWSAHKQLEDKSNFMKDKIAYLEKENQELKRRFEERQKEILYQQELKEKEKEELLKKKKLAIEHLYNILQKKQNEQISLVEKEIESLKDKWCIDEIKKIDLEKILKECYQQLIKTENLEEYFKENVKQLVKELIKENEVNYLNLQIIGKTGVGKSTLINSIFGEKVAEEKKGKPCTMETRCYENSEYNIRIYDTRGIEISKNFDIDKLFKETFKEIKEKCEKNEPNDLIHCLLYCFTGTRFETEEGEILTKLRKTYEGKKLSIILVYTQDREEEEEGEEEEGEEEVEGFNQLFKSINEIFEDKCKESISDEVEKISLVKVLAKKFGKKKHITPPKGLDILIKKCFEKGKYTSKYACLSAIKFSGVKRIKVDYLNIKNDILKEKEKFLNNIFEKNSGMIIFEDIIEKIFITFSLIKNRNIFMNESFSYIKSINKKIIELVLDKEERIFRKYVKEKANNIAKILIDEQTKIGKNYEFGFGNNIKDSNEFSYKISILLEDKFQKTSQINAIKNAAKIISLIIIDSFMNYFIEDYLKEFESDDIKTFLDNSLKSNFSSEVKSKIDNLIKDLVEYQNKNKKASC